MAFRLCVLLAWRDRMAANALPGHFHRGDKRGAFLWRDAPTRFQARLELCFQTRWTDLNDIESMWLSSTHFSAKSRRLHLAQPSGAGPQAMAMMRASASPVILGGTGGEPRFLLRKNAAVTHAAGAACSAALLPESAAPALEPNAARDASSLSGSAAPTLEPNAARNAFFAAFTVCRDMPDFSTIAACFKGLRPSASSNRCRAYP